MFQGSTCMHAASLQGTLRRSSQTRVGCHLWQMHAHFACNLWSGIRNLTECPTLLTLPINTIALNADDEHNDGKEILGPPSEMSTSDLIQFDLKLAASYELKSQDLCWPCLWSPRQGLAGCAPLRSLPGVEEEACARHQGPLMHGHQDNKTEHLHPSGGAQIQPQPSTNIFSSHPCCPSLPPATNLLPASRRSIQRQIWTYLHYWCYAIRVTAKDWVPGSGWSLTPSG